MADVPPAAAPPAALAPPTASLSNLPMEIKAQIVSLASVQDRRYLDRWEIVGGVRPAAHPLVERHLDNEWRGRSVAALSQTCRTFYLLTREYVFESLNGDQLADVYFLLRIFPLHAAHILEIKLLPSEPELLTRALALLPLLPNLRRLVLDGSAAGELFGGTSLFGAVQAIEDQNPNARLRCEPLRLVAARLEHIELLDFEATLDATFILQAATSLQSVSLMNCLDGGVEDEVTLAEHLAGLRGLRALTIGGDAGGLVLGTGIWSAQRWRGPLQTIDLQRIVLTSEVVAFIDALAPALRHLSLRRYSKPHAPSPLTLFKVPFPSLISFTLLHATYSDLAPIMTSLAGPPRTPGSDEPEHPLKKLRLDVSGYLPTNARTTESILAAISLFPNLTLLDFTRNTLPLPIDQQHLLAPSADRGVYIPTSAVLDRFVGRESPVTVYGREIEALASRELASRHASLKRAIDFASRSVDSMLRNGDLEEMELAFEALGEMWGLKLLEDD